jgi:ribosomal protein L17
MLYRPPAEPATVSVQTGRKLAYRLRGCTALQRAALAADLITGKIQIIGPTVRQAAALARVSVPLVTAARKGTVPARRRSVDGLALIALAFERVAEVVARDSGRSIYDVDLMLADARRACEALI